MKKDAVNWHRGVLSCKHYHNASKR